MFLNLFIRKKEKSATTGSEKWSRSVVKAVSWRIVGTLDTIIISWIITGNIHFAYTIGAIELVTKMVLYVIHERIWDKFKWGKR